MCEWLKRGSILVWLLMLFPGCGAGDQLQPEVTVEVGTEISSAQLKQQLDEVLDFTYSERFLDTENHAAWQILHGALTYQRDFLVRYKEEMTSAVDFVLGGGHIKGWTFERGKHGPRALLEEGTKTGQGHADQWFAVMAQSELAGDQPIEIHGELFSMSDWVAQVQFDLPRNVLQEYSWTLIGLTSYLPTSAHWTASDGKSWSIERLMAIELDQDINSSACGGTHRLIGLSMALNQHLAQGGELKGVWQQADEKIKEAMDLARRYQNSDGGFSSRYFNRPGISSDLANSLGTTGHVLEFLAISMTAEQLNERWMQRAVIYLCDLFRKTEAYDLECGALYHAAHGLALYRQRVFGKRNYRKLGMATTASNSSTPSRK